MKTKIIFFIVFINYYGLKMCPAVILMKALKCMTYCPNYFRLGQCELKNDTLGNLEAFIVLRHVKEPVVRCNVQLTFGKKSKRRISLIFNNTFDACTLLAGRNKNRIFSEFYQMVVPFSNLNHSCPYDHDIIVRKFNFKHLDNPLPWPEGDYAFELNFIFDKSSRVNVKLATTYIKGKQKQN